MTDSQGNPANRVVGKTGYAVVAIVAGAACAIIALLHASGIWYAVIGVLLGLAYAVISVMQRGGDGRNRDRR